VLSVSAEVDPMEDVLFDDGTVAEAVEGSEGYVLSRLVELPPVEVEVFPDSVVLDANVVGDGVTLVPVEVLGKTDVLLPNGTVSEAEVDRAVEVLPVPVKLVIVE
jgi:hypothetical protein